MPSLHPLAQLGAVPTHPAVGDQGEEIRASLSASPPQDVVLFPLQSAFQFRTEALAFVSRDLRMFLLVQGEVTEKESPASFILMWILSFYL